MTRKNTAEILLGRNILATTADLLDHGLGQYALACSQQEECVNPLTIPADAYQIIRGNLPLNESHATLLDQLPSGVQSLVRSSMELYAGLSERISTKNLHDALLLDDASKMALVEQFSATSRGSFIVEVIATLPLSEQPGLLARYIETSRQYSYENVSALKLLATLAPDKAKALADDLAIDILRKPSRDVRLQEFTLKNILPFVSPDNQLVYSKLATYLKNMINKLPLNELDYILALASDLPDTERWPIDTLIARKIDENGLEDEWGEDACMVMENLQYLPEDNRGHLIKKVFDYYYPLESDVFSIHAVLLAVTSIPNTAPSERTALIRHVLESASSHPSYPFRAIEAIHSVPPEEVPQLTSWILNQSSLDEFARLSTVYRQDVTPETSKDSLLNGIRAMLYTLLTNNNLDYYEVDQLAYVAAVAQPDKHPELSVWFADYAKALLQPGIDSSGIVRIAINAAEAAPLEDALEIYEMAVRHCLRMLDEAKHDFKRDNILTSLDYIPRDYLMRTLGTMAVDFPNNTLPPLISPLHKAAPTEGVAKFNKDGSDTYIGSDETNVRIISISAYDAWLRAYLHDEAWQDFGYVPIEPICQVEFADESTTDVAVKTISLRGGSLRETLHLYEPAIIAQVIEKVDTIKDRLRNVVKVVHGHDHHGGNFVLVPEVVDGKADPSRLPRVYIIDFDLAVHAELKKAQPPSRMVSGA